MGFCSGKDARSVQQWWELERICSSAASAHPHLSFGLRVNMTAAPSSVSLRFLGSLGAEIQAHLPAAIIFMITFFLCLIVLLSGTDSS